MSRMPNAAGKVKSASPKASGGELLRKRAAKLGLQIQRLILPESNSGTPDSGIVRFRGRIPPQHQNRKLSACSGALPQPGLCDSKLTKTVANPDEKSRIALLNYRSS